MRHSHLVVFAALLFGLSPFTKAQTAADDKPPQPLLGRDSTFLVTVKAPEEPVKAGSTFLVKISFQNTADQKIKVQLFEHSEDIPSPLDIRDSMGRIAFTEGCSEIVRKNPPFGPKWGSRFIAFLEKGEHFDDDFVKLGDPDASCFESDVPGTYTIQLRMLDPYTRKMVYSNKVSFTITK